VGRAGWEEEAPFQRNEATICHVSNDSGTFIGKIEPYTYIIIIMAYVTLCRSHWIPLCILAILYYNRSVYWLLLPFEVLRGAGDGHGVEFSIGDLDENISQPRGQNHVLDSNMLWTWIYAW
jgi:hypothetical protein